MENQIQDQAVAETNKPIIAMEQMQEKQQQPQVLELVADRILQMEFRPTAHLAKGYVMGIHVAASMGIYDLVQNLALNDPKCVNARNKGSWTPLMYAAQCDHDQVCRLLLYYGASPYLRSNQGQTATDIAWDWGHQSVLDVLAPGWKLPATIAAEEALAAANAAAAAAAAAAGQTTLVTAVAIPPVTKAKRTNKINQNFFK